MASSDMPTDPPPRLRFNYITTHSSAQDFDYYADLPVIDLLRQEVLWWEANDQSSHRTVLFPGKWNNTRHPSKRGERIAQFGTMKFDRPLLFPLSRSYCSYVVSESRPMLASTPTSFTLSGEPQEPEFQPSAREDFPPEALTRWYKWETPAVPSLPAATLSEGDTQAYAKDVNVISLSQAQQQPLIYLFNIVVALEWEPDAQDQQQLAWAFRRASDFLYDVSDGSLAFGQVVFITSKDNALHADIMIAASNRFQGRSWVGSIHERPKRMPLRVGRGVWRRGLSMPWDEPEGYRVIVHEWGHYALHLRDAYLRRIFVALDQDILKGVPGKSDRYIFAPNPYLVHSTVMEALEGTSELSLQQNRFDRNIPSERELLHALYPSSLNKRSSLAAVNSGPGQMRFPLPHIVFEASGKKVLKLLYHASQFTSVVFRDLNDLPVDDKENNIAVGQNTASKKSNYDQCWLYVLSPKSQSPTNRKLIAQGTFELRSSYELFRLIGAEENDLLVAVIDQPEGPPSVYKGTITIGTENNAFEKGVIGSTVELHTAKVQWEEVVYREPPRVVVRPVYTEEQNQPNDPPYIRIAVDLLSNMTPTLPIWVCPLMEEVQEYDPFENSEFGLRIKGLDGHVVVWFDDDPFIVCFSHGGNPPSHTIGGHSGQGGASFYAPPSTLSNEFLSRERRRADGATVPSASVHPPFTPAEVLHERDNINIDDTSDDLVSMPSITAGSSDGTVRIYFSILKPSPPEESSSPFSQEADVHKYDGLRFVTTVQQDMASYKDSPCHGAKAIGYPFSIACSKTLQNHHIHMTLEVRYSGLERPKRNGTVYICRLKEATQAQQTPIWEKLPTYRFGAVGVSAVATCFDEHNTPGSIFFNGEPKPFEQYQLWWIPDPQPPAS